MYQVVYEVSREGIKIIWKTVGKSSSNSSGMKTLQSEIYRVLAAQKVYSKGILTSSNLWLILCCLDKYTCITSTIEKLSVNQMPLCDCWRALARQQPILYNSEKSLNLSDVRLETCTVDFVLYIRAFGCACECTWKYRSISSNSTAHLEIKDKIRGHDKWGERNMDLEEDEIFVLAALLCEQFCQFMNRGAKISIKSDSMRSFLSQCIQQQWSVRQKCFHSE